MAFSLSLPLFSSFVRDFGWRRAARGQAPRTVSTLLLLSVYASAVEAAPTWRAPRECPTIGTFEAKVAELDLESVDGLSFDVVRKHGGYRMQVRDHEVQTHQLKADDCGALLDAALMILRLGQSDPDLGKKSQEGPPSPQKSRSADSTKNPVEELESKASRVSKPVSASRNNKGQRIKTSPPKEDASVSSRARKPERTSRWKPRTNSRNRRSPQGVVLLGAGMGWGALPGMYGHALAHLGLRLRTWRLLGGAKVYWGAHSPSSIEELWRASFGVAEGRILGCKVLGRGPWSWPICLGASVGQLSAWRDTEGPGPTKVQQIWWSALGQAGAERDLRAGFFAHAQLEVGVLPRRPSVEIEHGPRLCCGPVTVTASLGVGMRLGRGR